MRGDGFSQIPNQSVTKTKPGESLQLPRGGVDSGAGGWIFCIFLGGGASNRSMNGPSAKIHGHVMSPVTSVMGLPFERHFLR